MKPILPVLLILSACTSPSEAEAEDASLEKNSNKASLGSGNLDTQEAVKVAFPSARPLRDADGVEWSFANHRLVKLRKDFALISEGQATDETVSHSTSGRLDIFYLNDPDNGLYVKERFPEAVRVGSTGSLAEWSLTNKFTDEPVIYASGGFTGQGITEGCAVLTELSPDGPRTIAVIPDYYAGTSFDGKEFETKGTIGKILKGESFVVAYSGDERGQLRYTWNGTKFATSDKAILSHCGFD